MEQSMMGHKLASTQEWTRRSFLGLGAAAVGAAILPGSASAASIETAPKPLRTLSFFNVHTSERLTTAYWSGGIYKPEALGRINTLLRDYRVNEIKPIDKGLLDLLHELHATLGVDEPFHVISGYRSPRTNAMLRERGGKDSGVASGSLHMEGKAIDIRVPGIDLDDLRRAARALKRGGVGYYPSSNFVHVDTGRVRFW
jgi:uncharacterized protein YcbK (DUF882 family)